MNKLKAAKWGQCDNYCIFIAARHFTRIEDFIHLEMAVKRFRGTLEKFFYNPIPLTKKTLPFFPNLRTLHLYSPKDTAFIRNKIPFYLGYFVSIFNLDINKNDVKILNEEFDVKKITQTFEEGSVNEEYNEMVDFGMSSDLILKLIKNQINKTNILNNEYRKEDYDEYENIMIDEFKSFYMNEN